MALSQPGRLLSVLGAKDTAPHLAVTNLEKSDRAP